MSKERFIGILVVIIIILIVLVLLVGNLSNIDFPGKSEEAKRQAEEMARLLEVAHTMCPEDRMSSFHESVLDSEGYQANRQYRELEGNLQCDIKGTDQGECIIVILNRTEWCADEGSACPSGWGKNIGTYQFKVDTGGESVMDFSPDCIGTMDTTGCCIMPTRGIGTDGLWGCEWWIYNWYYEGDGNSLNLLLPNGQTAKIWSRFADKSENGRLDEHTCTCYDNKPEEFHRASYAYTNGELKVKYTKCCPEGWTWQDELNYAEFMKGCCVDEECINFYCIKSGGTYYGGYCWIESGPGQSCNEVMPSGAQCVPEAAPSMTKCGLHEKYLGEACTSCGEASAGMNPSAPYLKTDDNTCYYYNEAYHTSNPFDCDAKNAGISRLCAFRSFCPGENIWGYVPSSDMTFISGTCAGGCYSSNHIFGTYVGNNVCYWNYLGHKFHQAQPDSCVWEDMEPCPSAAQCTDTGCTA